MPDFIREFEELVCHFKTQKFNLQRHLERNYRENVHYIKYHLKTISPGIKQHGGNNRIVYMLTEEAFVLFKNQCCTAAVGAGDNRRVDPPWRSPLIIWRYSRVSVLKTTSNWGGRRRSPISNQSKFSPKSQTENSKSPRRLPTHRRTPRSRTHLISETNTLLLRQRKHMLSDFWCASRGRPSGLLKHVSRLTRYVASVSNWTV